ncbi:MAG: hypothetical protein JNK45_17665, partial [Myxococcales bacterium]|nr:hypothetical protein [Myxococcales bacterium]
MTDATTLASALVALGAPTWRDRKQAADAVAHELESATPPEVDAAIERLP